ncbi:MAG: winged helix-turn-helix domain-containing protein, partial [Acidimicrobiales bacterium]
MPALLALSAADARRVALVAQGLAGPRPRSARGVLERVGAVQLDTISVLARSHELVAYARLGPVPRSAVEGAYWTSAPASTFEYWAHAACILPLEEWPAFSFARRARRVRGHRWHRLADADRACGDVLARLAAEGPLSATELGGARGGGPWWDWSEPKIAVEWLLDIGEVACTYRRGWRRVYDLAERAVPERLREASPSDEECVTRLTELAGRALGVGTAADLASYFGLPARQVAAAAGSTSLEPVSVEGWRDRAWAHPDALAVLSGRARSRVTLLSPFDSLVWDRPRTERLFGFRHRLEAYVPAPKRVHGYYTMPL